MYMKCDMATGRMQRVKHESVLYDGDNIYIGTISPSRNDETAEEIIVIEH